MASEIRNRCDRNNARYSVCAGQPTQQNCNNGALACPRLTITHAPGVAGRDVYSMLGMGKGASEAELTRGMRLALRLLLPDAGINMPLRGTRDGERIEAAFKRVNNLKDMRIEQWFSSEATR